MSTSKSVIKDGALVQEHSIGAKTTMVGVSVMAALVALGIAGYIAGQKRAAQEEEGVGALSKAPTSTQQAVVVAAAAPAGGSKTDGLESAVEAAVTSARQSGDQAFVALQRAAAMQETPEQLKERLDKLSKDKAALAAYNKSIINQVKEAPAGADFAPSALEEAVAAASARQTAAIGAAEAAALKKEAADREGEGRTVEVRPGDTLWILAKRVYGDPYQYKKIFESNPRLLRTPDHIFPGQILRVPT